MFPVFIYNVYTALIYADSSPHIGHLYEIIIASVFRNYISLWFNTRLIIGTDDHGLKIKNSVKSLVVKDFVKVVNINSNKILVSIIGLRVFISDWISTSQDRHVNKVCSKFSSLVYIGSVFYKSCYCGWYLPSNDVFCSIKDIKFSYNNMYIYKNQPVEWIEESNIFINHDVFKSKIFAIYKARLIKTPNIEKGTLSLILNSMKDVCITRQKNVNYGIDLSFDNEEHILWVWMDALLAYSSSWGKNKVHIVGKDIITFHLTYYIMVMLIFNIELPKLIYQHCYLEYGFVKISKSLDNFDYKFNSLNKEIIQSTLCSKSNKDDMELDILDFTKMEIVLLRNLGNLIKRLARLVVLYKPDGIEYLATSDWLILSYSKYFEKVIRLSLYKFKINTVLNMLLKNTSWINSKITDYKLWQNINVRHKAYIYMHIIANILFWLKPIIGNKANEIMKQMYLGNWYYMPIH